MTITNQFIKLFVLVIMLIIISIKMFQNGRILHLPASFSQWRHVWDLVVYRERSSQVGFGLLDGKLGQVMILSLGHSHVEKSALIVIASKEIVDLQKLTDKTFVSF